MTIETAVLLAMAVLLVWLSWRQHRIEGELRNARELPGAGLQVLQREVEAIRSGVDGRLREQTLQTQELSQRIGQLQRATEQVEQLGLSLDELHKILRPPQQRGAFGERLLEDQLADMLPRECYRLQHTYRHSGVRVDAAILFAGERLLPIDSKFPLENYRRFLDLTQAGSAEADDARRAFMRDVRRHVDEVATKYLSADDGALDVAFMYVPSEAVFHEIALGGTEGAERSAIEYCLRRRVVPVSPNSLYAYLAVVRMGLRGFRLQEGAREILGQLVELRAEVDELASRLGTALTQARHSLANLTDADDVLRRIARRLSAVERSGPEVEAVGRS